MKKTLLILSLLLSYFCISYAGVPNQITYTGSMRSYGQPVNGKKNVTFSIYPAQTGGIASWSSGPVEVKVSSGTFSYNLTPIIDWRGKDFWLELIIGDKILSPRTKLTAQAYALHSRTAEDIEKSSGSSIHFAIGSSTQVVISGSGYTLEAMGSAKFNGTVIVSTPTASDHAATKGYVDARVGGSLGTGSAGQTLRNDSGAWVASSLIYNNGLKVGIGNTNPQYVLDVSNNARFSGTVLVSTPTAFDHAATKGYVDAAVVGTSSLWAGSGDIYRASGKVGIGTASPMTSLDVESTNNTLGKWQMTVADSNDMAPNVGGGIGFWGKYTSGGTLIDGAGLKLVKDNGVTGDSGFGLGLYTRANGGSLSEKVKITGAGHTTFFSGITASSGTFNIIKAQTLALGALGTLQVTPASNSTTTFKVTNAAGITVFAVDTTNSQIYTAQKTWFLISEINVASPVQTITVSGLNGDTDIMYHIIARVINGASSGGTELSFIRPNNDSTISNYPDYNSYAGIQFGQMSINKNCFSDIMFYAKSGFIRSAIANCYIEFSNTTGGAPTQFSGGWTNTTDNITSLVFYCTAANGFGAGTNIQIWARR